MLRSSPILAVRIGAVVAATLLAAVPPHADPRAADDLGPAEPDLREYLRCSQEAMQRLLDHDEAEACALAYTKVKLSFLPGVSLDDFNRLAPREKAAMNLVAYERYVRWSARNTAGVAGSGGAAISASTPAAR